MEQNSASNLSSGRNDSIPKRVGKWCHKARQRQHVGIPGTSLVEYLFGHCQAWLPASSTQSQKPGDENQTLEVPIEIRTQS